MKISPWLLLTVALAWKSGWLSWYCAGFLCIALHELAHGMVARMWNAPIEGVRLGPAGLQLILKEPLPANLPLFALHMAGPVCNGILALFCAGGFLLSVQYGGQAELHRELWRNGCLMNCCLAIFNLLPLYPLDGGKLLLLILSENWGYGRAFRILYFFSCIFSLFLFFLGIYLVQYNSVNFFLCILAVHCFRQARNGRRYMIFGMEKHRGRNPDRLGFRRLSMCYEDEPALRLLERVPAGQQRDFSVVDRRGKLRGLLLEDELWSGLYGQGMDISVSQLLSSRDLNKRKVNGQ